MKVEFTENDESKNDLKHTGQKMERQQKGVNDDRLKILSMNARMS